MSRSRRNSVVGTRSARDSFENGRDGARHAALAPALTTEIEAEGDDDVTNGLLHHRVLICMVYKLTEYSWSVKSPLKRRQATKTCLLAASYCRVEVESTGSGITAGHNSYASAHDFFTDTESEVCS